MAKRAVNHHVVVVGAGFAGLEVVRGLSGTAVAWSWLWAHLRGQTSARLITQATNRPAVTRPAQAEVYYPPQPER